MVLGSGGNLGTLTLFIKADTTNLDSAINSVEQKMQRYGNQFSGLTKSLSLTPTVDDSALTNLNKHLDLKQKHFGQVNQLFKSSPLAPAVDLSKINSLETKLKNIQRLSREVLNEQRQGQADVSIGEPQQGRGGVTVQPTIRVNPRLASVTNRLGGNGQQVDAGGLKGTVPVGKIIDAAKIIITSATISVGAGKVAETTKSRVRSTAANAPINASGLNPKVDETVADSLAAKLDEIERRIDRINNKTISIKEDGRTESRGEQQGGFNPVAGAIAAIAFQGLAKGISATIAGQVQSVGDGLLKSFAQSDTFKNLTKTLNIPPEVAQSFGREAGKEFKKGQQTGILGFLSKTVGNIFSGITQGIGYRISAGLIQGLERSFGIKLKDVIADAFEAAFNQTKQTLGDAAKGIFGIDFSDDPPKPPTPPANVIKFPTQQEQEIAQAVSNGQNVVKFRPRIQPNPPDGMKIPNPVQTGSMVLSQQRSQSKSAEIQEPSGGVFGFVGDFFGNAQKTIQAGLDGLSDGVNSFADYLSELNPFFKNLVTELRGLISFDFFGASVLDQYSAKAQDSEEKGRQSFAEKGQDPPLAFNVLSGVKPVLSLYNQFAKFIAELQNILIKINVLPAVIFKSIAATIPAFKPLAQLITKIQKFFVDTLYGGKWDGMRSAFPLPNTKASSGREYNEVLGVSRSATRKEVIGKFKQLSKEYHPDQEGGSPEKMQELTEAYSIWKQRQEAFGFTGRPQQQKPAASPDALKQVMTEGFGEIGDIFLFNSITSFFTEVAGTIKSAMDSLLGSMSSFFGGIADNIVGLAGQIGLVELDTTDDQKVQEVFADLVRQAGTEAGESVSDGQIPKLQFDDDIAQAYGSKGLYFPNTEKKTLASGKVATVDQNTLVLRREAQKMLLAIANGIEPRVISEQFGDAAESLTHEVKHAFQFKFGQADYSTFKNTNNFGAVTPLEDTSEYARLYAEQAAKNSTAQNAANQHNNPEEYLDFIKNIEADAEHFGGKYRDVFRPVTQKYQERSQEKAADAGKQLNLVQQIFKPITDLLAKLAAQIQGLAKATLATAVRSISQIKEWFKHLYQDPAYTLQQAAMAPLNVAGDVLASPVRAVEQNIRDTIAKTVAGAKNALEGVDIRVEGEEEFGVAASALYEALSLGVDLLPLDQLIANFGDIVGDIQKLQSLKISSDNQFAQFGEIMSQLPAVRQLVTTGARNRKDRNIKNAAEQIRRTYDPIQGNEFDEKKEVQLFAVGGYRNAMGMEQPHAGYGSIELAEQFKIATGNDKNVQVNPHVNAYSDSKNAVMRTVGNVIGTQANDDAVALARRAYAAHQKNPEQRIVLGGHSGGGYNVQDALEILKELGVPAKGFGMQTPNFNVTRKLGVDDYEALGVQGDSIVNDKLELVRAAGFNAEQDKVFKGATHSPDEFLARKDSGETFLRNVYGEERQQPKGLKNNIKALNAPRVQQQLAKSIADARNVLENNSTSAVAARAAIEKLRAANQEANKSFAKFPDDIQLAVQISLTEMSRLESKLKGIADPGQKVVAAIRAKINDISESDLEGLKKVQNEIFNNLGSYSQEVNSEMGAMMSEVTSKVLKAKQIAQAAMAKPEVANAQSTKPETALQLLISRQAKRFNYDVKQMPKLVVDNKRLQQAGAKALYSVKDNQIVITSAIEKLLSSSPEELKKFGVKYAEEVKDLIHEVKHAFQFKFGEVNYADLANGAEPGVMTPFAQTSQKSQQYGNFAANTDYYKQYAAQMPEGFLDIVRATEADATEFENMWQEIMQGLISDLEEVQSASGSVIGQPVAYKFSVPGAFGKAATSVSGQAQSVGNAAATKMVEELEKATKHLNKIAANPKLQQSFGKLQQDAGNLSIRMNALIGSIQAGTVDIGDLPNEMARIFDEMQAVVGAAANVPGNLQPAPTLREKAGNAARSFQQNAFGGFFDPKRSAQRQMINEDVELAGIQNVANTFNKVITNEESAFAVIQAAVIGDWSSAFFSFYEEIDKALDSAADTIIDFVERIPGLSAFAGFLRGAKQFKAVALGLVGLQAAFQGFNELRQIFDGIEEVFIGAAMGAEKFQRTMTFVLGDAVKASSVIKKIKQDSANLGINTQQAIQGYTQIGAASKETALEGTGVDQISSSLNQASGVYGLSGEEQGRINTAVAQMISKNTVSAEELRQQLGEVLPGSFNIAARAAGKTTAEFNQMLETGQVIATDFLPKFAQQLSAETSSGLVGAMNSSQAATNRLESSIKSFQTAMGEGLLGERNFVFNRLAEGMRLLEKHAQTLANLMGTIFFRALFKAVGALILFGRNLIFALTNVGTWLKVFYVWDKVVNLLGGSIKRLAIQFAVFTLFFDMIGMIGKAWGNASGGLENFVKSSEDGMRKYIEAVNEARKSNQEFSSSLPKDTKDVKGSSMMEDTFIGGIVGKENARNFESLLVDSLNNGMITGAPIKMLTGGQGLKKFAEKKLEDTDLASNEIMSGANESMARMMNYRGTKKGGATQELRKVQDVDQKLRDVQRERRGLSRTDPSNMEGIKALQKQESELLKEREKQFKPLGALQAKTQSEIDGMKEALKKYEELASVGGVNAEGYKTKTDQLKASIAAAEKEQIAFNRSIGGAADSFTYLQRSLQQVADKLAGADAKVKMLSNSAKRGVLAAESNSEITSGQSQFAQTKIETSAIDAQLRERKAAIVEMQALLSQLDADKVLEANGITNLNDVTPQELNTLADRSKDSPQDTEVFKRLAEVKQVQIEVDDLETQLAERTAQATQQIKDANKQINDYFRDIGRQSAELALTTKEAQAQIALQQQKNKLKSALQGFQDNFFSSFVDSIIEGMDSLNEPLNAQLEREREFQSAQFAREDRDRQGTELYKSLPLDTQNIKLDFSAIDSAPVKELQVSLEQSAKASKNVTDATKEAGAAIGDSANQANTLQSNVAGVSGKAKDATTAIQGSKGAIADSANEANNLKGNVADVGAEADNVRAATDSVTTALQGNISEVQNVNTELTNNQASIQGNQTAVEEVNDAVGVQTQKVVEATAATNETQAATSAVRLAWSLVTGGVSETIVKTFELFKGLANNIPFLNQFSGIFGSWEGFIQKLIGKTWEFFKGLADNIPFLNQIGETIGGWGQNVGGAIGAAANPLGAVVNAGIDIGQQIMGGGAVSDAAKKVIEVAKQWVGKDFAPGLREQCANFVRNVLKQAGLGDKIGVTKEAIDGLESGSALASGFFGKDIGTIIKDKKDAKAGDLVAFMGTYGGYGKDTITHVGVYAGDDMIYDRSTSSKPVMHRSLDTFGKGNYVFVRPHAYGDKGGKGQLKTANTGAFGKTSAGMNTMLAQMDAEAKQSPTAKATAKGARDYTKLSKEQNIQAIVDEAIKAGVKDKNQIAYIVATAMHESGGFSLVQEQGSRNYFNKYEGDVENLGNTQAGDGYRFRGHGFTQLTGRRNFEKQSRRMGLDLVNNPNLLADPGISANVLVSGMVNGEFTGNKLSKYIGNGKVDISNARRTVNGYAQDQVDKVNAEYNKIAPQIDKYIANAGKGGAPVMTGGSSAPAQAAPAAPRPIIQPVPFASMQRQMSVSGTTVDASKLSIAEQKSAQMQRDQQATALKKEQARIEEARIQGEQRQRQRLEQTRQSLREVDQDRIQSGRQFRDMGLDIGEQTPEREAARKKMGINDTYDDLEKEIAEKIRKSTAARDQATVTVQKLSSSEYVPQPGQNVQKDIEAAKAAIAAAEKYLGDLTKIQGELKGQRQSRVQFEEQQAAREQKLREQQQKFATEEVSISKLEAEAQRLSGMKDRGIRDQGVENLPKIEATIAARREELSLQQKISEIDENIKKNPDNPAIVGELNKQKTGLQERLGIVKKTIDENRKYSEEVARRDREAIQKDAAASLENAELGVVEAKLSALKEVQTRTPYAEEVKAIPSLEKLVAARRAVLESEQKIRDIDQRQFEKKITPEQAGKEKQLERERLAVAQKAVTENAAYAAQVMTREGDRRNREANAELARGELSVLKQQLEAAQQIAQLNPAAPEAAGIAPLQQKIELKEAELALAEQIAAVEEKRFKTELTDAEATDRISKLKQENEILVKNINTRAARAQKEQEFARLRTQLELKEQDAGLKGSIAEALSKNIEYGRNEGDPIEMRFEQQRVQQNLGLEKTLLELDELEASGKRSKEEVDKLRESYRLLNEISLDNLILEQQRAVEDKAMEISGRFNQSRGAVLGGRSDLLGSLGLDTQAKEFRKVAAIADQKQNYSQQSLELERFIAQMGLGAERALELRTNLSEVNQMSLEKINNEFSTMNELMVGVQGSFESAFTSILDGSKSIGEAALDFLKGVGSQLASMASKLITDELFGKIMGKGNKDDAEKEAGLIGKGGVLGALRGGENPLGAYSFANPLPVAIASAGALSGLTGGGLGGFGKAEDFTSSIFGGTGGFFGEQLFGNKPLPVDMVAANDSIFSSLTNGIMGIFGGSGGNGGGLGGILSGALSLFGGNSGGLGGGLGFLSAIPNIFGIFNEGGRIGSSGNPIEEGLEAAMSRERAMSGGKKPYAIVAHEGEFIVPSKVASRLTKGEQNYLLGKTPRAASVPNYSQGGYIGATAGTNISNVTQNMGGSTRIEGSTVNMGEGMGNMSRQDAAALKAAIDKSVMETISRQTRPRGLLAR